ncbi:BREX-1 system adenine-specific DNA-methyltransferase PglX [Exiguobacterium sp. SH0S1]|uniref:BREX-1 system adenine-specific DNA-methyltransferase PglX n=1 Tax=Exiguobacterium sp. SH0S1 TaxID=2510949 RepID=UPI00103C40CA|nr:BREX-1 system adenine-specific DNA-methyltransferase PglX [Exiguobacterium sp. SH0S1]TCI75720.1 BREX-1 system adenine-specific DNA-methyltransferase PglX [Exiguobacterium sp. SH0S1]
MNKTELKNFAVNARRELLKQVSLRANLFGITEKTVLTIEEQFGQLIINGTSYPKYMKSAFRSLQKQLESKGYEQVLEEVAYTWFNRIIAIRYMEVHDYLPERVNVLSSSTGRVDPDILTEYESMELSVDKTRVNELLMNGNTEIAFRMLFIAQCNALNEVLPFMFEKIQDYTELLLPDYLLDKESIINVLVKNEELNESFNEIEVIGWLYQYYIAEEKDRVFKQKAKYKKEEIPYATQLFTPKWIVQYMVQNSLCRYWTEAHPEHEDMIENWDYFLKHEEKDFKDKIAPYINKELKVEEIKCFDPAMGSGHILVYMFDVLHEIYTKCGYPDREIPSLILENNLYGLDIDDRAYQLASFSLVMKAMQYNKRFLKNVQRKNNKLNLASIQETNAISDEVIAYIAGNTQGENFKRVKAFIEQFHNAKTYGSLINISEREISYLEKRLENLKTVPNHDLFQVDNHEIAIGILPSLIDQTKIMRNEYDIVIMNPPYMSDSSMNKELYAFIKEKYPNSKADLFAAFMQIDHYFKDNSFYAAINQHAWMFLSSFEELRKEILDHKYIDSMLHLGAKAFEDINGEVVQNTTFILRNYRVAEKPGIFIRAVDDKSPQEKKDRLAMIASRLENTNMYMFKQTDFQKIPGSPIAYWVTPKIQEIFLKNDSLGEIAKPRQGMKTLNNDYFIKNWYEVDYCKIYFNADSIIDAKESKKKWFPLNHGGEYRKHYGNNESIVNWENDGYEMKALAIEKYKSVTRTITNIQFYFKEGLTWTAISSGGLSFRSFSKGYLFSNAGFSIFDIKNKEYLSGLLNSIVTKSFLQILSPTLNYNVRDIANIPVIFPDQKTIEKVQKKVNECINISFKDWNDYEKSWDFRKHPFLDSEHKRLKDVFYEWEILKNEQFYTLKTLEEELNEKFIEIYELENELEAKVDDKGIKINKAEKSMDVPSFLSYFIGCLVGRYSLDVEGVVYAGGKWDDSKYTSFIPNKYGLIQFTDVKYFENDIIGRLREFLAIAFSEDTIDENIHWLADSLVMKIGEDPETRLRRFFTDEFYTYHCKIYQKRPIYWLVDSGKQKGLRTLFYMHRYQSDTMATIRFEHLQETQVKYNHEIDAIDMRLVNPNLSATEKRNLDKQKTVFKKRLEELLEFDKKLAEYANAQIPIDLDNGVVANYSMFDGVLRKIK